MARASKEDHVVRALRALAQSKRLEIFRLLIQMAPQGLPAGMVARRVGLCASTLTFHLSQLENAGLIHSRRQSRNIYYWADPSYARQLLAFLLVECCSESRREKVIMALQGAGPEESFSQDSRGSTHSPARSGRR